MRTVEITYLDNEDRILVKDWTDHIWTLEHDRNTLMVTCLNMGKNNERFSFRNVVGFLFSVYGRDKIYPIDADNNGKNEYVNYEIKTIIE